MSSSKQLKIGAVLSYMSIVINVFAGLIYTPWMVTKIGQSDYGLYTLVNSLITMFMVDFGLSSATARYLAKYNAEGNRQKAESFLGAIYKLYLWFDAIVAVILIIVFFNIENVYANLTGEEIIKFKVIFVISALFSLVSIPFVTFNGILTAYEKFGFLKSSEVLCRVSLVVFTVIALLLGYGLYSLVIVYAAVGLMMILYKFIIIRKTVPLRVNFKGGEKNLYKDIFGFSIWTTVSALAQRLVFTATPSVLGIVSSTVQIAVFGVVQTIESYTYTITSALNGFFMPKIARIVTNENAEENLHPLLIKVGKYQFAINGIIIAGFAVVGKDFITLWMGKEYTDAYIGILLVIISGIFYNSLQIANTTMVVKKKVKETALVNIMTGVVNVLLSFPLSMKFGVIGACASICIAYMLRAVVLLIIYHKKLPVDIPKFINQCYVRMSLPIIITISLGAVFNMVINGEGWLALIVKGTIVVCVYAASVLFIGLNKQERESVLEIPRKILRKIKR